MKLKKNLVLLGMMGSGKSTIGVLISKKLNINFIDVDKLIEKEANMKISEIFEKKGEIFFRNIEEKITLKTLNSYTGIISLGGGGYLNEKIKKEVNANNHSFWLNWNPKMILKRIKNSRKRPMIFNLNDNQILELIKKRSKIYSKAKFKINCNDLSKTEVVKKIIKIYENI